MGINGDAIAGDDSSASGMDVSQLPTENADVGASQVANALSQEDETHPQTGDEEIKAKDVSVEADRRMNVRKPWKEKKTAQNRMARDEIEIFEGKGAVGPSLLEITSPDKGYLKIMCKDDCEFLVPRKVVETFECVDIILHGDAIFKEKLEDVIRFPDIQPEIMEYVLRFVFIEYLNKLKAAQYWGANSPRLVFQFEMVHVSRGLKVNPLQVMDLIYVAHFLGIQDLLDVTATMVARHLQNVPDISSMPVDLAWCVAKKFTAQELFEAEEREDFLSLNLDTDGLWEKHCNKFLIEDIIKPIASSGSPPSYQTWGFSEGPSPTSWKSLYMALDLQQLADRQDGTSNELFFAEIKHKGKYADKHTIRPMFYEWVLRAPASLPLCSYLDGFPNLMSLHLVKLPLGNPLADGKIPCLVVGKILQSHPQLQILDVSETGFTTEAAILLSQGLQSHPRLQALCLAYNAIGTEGFSAIAEALPHLRTLKYLDVRGNGIASATTEDVVVALQSSALEELLLEGNLKSVKQRPVNAGIVTEQRAAANLGFGGVKSRGNGLSWDLRSKDSNASGCGKASVSEPEKILCTSLQAQEARLNPLEQVLPLLDGIPPNLRKIQLTQCDLIDTDISVLFAALGQHNSIQKLDLSDNNITATGATSIFIWLQGNDSLLELNLSRNKITDSCSDLLPRTLQGHTKLQKLSMCGNYTYGERNLSQIINAGVVRGEALVSTCGQRFMLDLRATDISFSTRAIIQRRAAEWTNSLHLVI